MNAPLAAALFGAVELAPRDPILGVTEAFVADANPNKVNLGVGVYCDDNGKVPLLDCVRQAERMLADKGAPHPYLPIDGIAAYDKAVQALLLGADSEIVQTARAVTVQALGGTGGLRVGADFLKRFAPGAKVWISDPSWENHRALFEAAGLEVGTYAYYDAATRGLDFAGMLAVARAPARRARSSCCTRAATTPPAWTRRRSSGRRSSRSCAAAASCPSSTWPTRASRRASPADGEIVRRFAATPGPLFIASSFSKSFSLYGERVGALSVVTGEQGRCRARALAAQADRARELLQPAVVRRPGRDHRAHDAGPARVVGAGTRRHARAHQVRARGAGAAPAGEAAGPRLHATC